MIVIFKQQFWILEVIYANQAILLRVNTYFLFAWLQCSVALLDIFNLANPFHPSLALINSLWKEKKLGTEYTHRMCARPRHKELFHSVLALSPICCFSLPGCLFYEVDLAATLQYFLLLPMASAKAAEEPWGRILELNTGKSLKSFPSCNFSQSPLQLCLEILFLQTHATSYSFHSSVTVHCKRERREAW
jgi:hypothetical protein